MPGTQRNAVRNIVLGAVAVGVVLMLMVLGSVLILLGNVRKVVNAQGVQINANRVEEVDYTQTVNSRLPGIAGPAAHITGTVTVIAKKCNVTKSDVTFTGQGFFTALQPSGLSQLIGSGQATRKPGCLTRTLIYTVPQAIQDRVKKLAAQGIKSQTYSIQGSDVPVDGSQTVTWSSESFILVP